MGSPTNNPFLCESTVDGKRCSNFASTIYKSAFMTRLVCDECSHRYKTGGPGGGVTNLMEFSLMELIPAREVLTMKLSRLERLNTKMRKLAALAAEERVMLERINMWLLLVFAVGFFFAAWGPVWILGLVGASYVGSLFGVRRWASVKWIPAKLKKINEEHGYPERESY